MHFIEYNSRVYQRFHHFVRQSLIFSKVSYLGKGSLALLGQVRIGVRRHIPSALRLQIPTESALLFYVLIPYPGFSDSGSCVVLLVNLMLWRDVREVHVAPGVTMAWLVCSASRPSADACLALVVVARGMRY